MTAFRAKDLLGSFISQDTLVNFSKFKLDPRILLGVEALGYKDPTPIQAQAIPLVLQGKDVIGLAQTGTGKTAAFTLPLLHKLMDGPRGRLRALIIVPTRELAEQIHDAIRLLGKETGLRSVTLYGGVNIMKQFQTLRRGVDIAIACPGRLLDHINRRNIDLSQVHTLVLDEADQMFDFGFFPTIRKILTYLPKQRQSLLFSATMPKAIRSLAEEILSNPVPVQIGELVPATTVTQKLYPVNETLKTELLVKIIQTHDTESVLIFTRTKHRAKRLAEHLESLGYSATSFQGNLSQSRRQMALDRFRTGKLKFLVATDIAARGIDVQNVSHVINFDMPATTEAYTHRIGRTGRASKLGAAFTLITNSDRHQIRSIERKLNQVLEKCIIPDFDYKATANSNTALITMDDDERPRRNMHAPRGGAHHDARKKFSGAPKSNRGPESGSQSTAFKKSKKPFYSKFKSSAGRK
ncbi:DEAD/DEAH box helicase [Rickettsiella endosymbiont of Dermanyssus gallinae]|uniref:DEAD/DEAH box helicase n=1 Tax=Rickettsiella endosymbiont of Dermanyssus gallinae TaxID=2856608 RepID=UPI001FE8ECFC|nr:DEAD/DEAH box helicase [Rickettsiella endosymbiont of Dermanyssus gallinae]